MIKFQGILHSLVYNLSVVGGNGTITRNQIYYPPSLFEHALKDKLASGGPGYVASTYIPSELNVYINVQFLFKLIRMLIAFLKSKALLFNIEIIV